MFAVHFLNVFNNAGSILFTHTALPCPPHSYYTDCVSTCPSTCNDIFASSLCEKTEECTEGCECDNNYVLSNGKCVPLSNCGCRDDDNNYYSVSSLSGKQISGCRTCRKLVLCPSNERERNLQGLPLKYLSSDQ